MEPVPVSVIVTVVAVFVLALVVIGCAVALADWAVRFARTSRRPAPAHRRRIAA